MATNDEKPNIVEAFQLATRLLSCQIQVYSAEIS